MSQNHTPSDRADALIGELQREQAGRLTVYLGAAPGVGKTYAMLARAHELKRQGIDVVVGIVETHGREETMRLTQGLEMLPRQVIQHRGKPLDELDLDRLLARRPRIALIDELAHRNVPGSRHERRWQDVEELLDAGIDVYTTVNVQHLESLNDVVHQITGVRVSETVPDLLFERLKDIRLVDLPPRELIERLGQGKVYVPDQAQRALASFFSPGNLTALRELAMQTVARHVDADLREHHTARGVQGAAIRRHVLIAIDGHDHSQYLVRTGSRMAERRGATWSVVFVEQVRDADARAGSASPDSPESKKLLEVDRAFRLARRLGGDTAIVRSDDITSAILDAAAAQGASAIVVGRTRERPVARIFNRTITQQLLQKGAQYEITIASTPKARAQARRSFQVPSLSSLGEGMDQAVLSTVIAVILGWIADQWIGLQDIAMIFLLAVLVVASRTRMTAAVVTALLSSFAYNFFFIDPRFTFEIAADQGVITVGIFLAVALIGSRLSSRLRLQVVSLRAANAHTVMGQSLARELSVAADLPQALQAGRRALRETVGADVWIRFGALEVPVEGSAIPNAKDRGSVDWTLRHGQASGRYTDTLSGSDWWFLPMNADEETRGVVGLRFGDQVKNLSSEQQRLAEAMVEDLAQAALRTNLVADLESARITSETERLRSALLTSVSHDLRSPLAAMIGAADSLQAYGASIPEDDKLSLLRSISTEGQRLDRYIQNLLDMTRLGHEGLKLERDWIGVDELIGSATRRLQRYAPSAKFEVRMQPNLPWLFVHPALVEQAFFNVLENAVKFSPPNAPVEVVVSENAESRLQIDVIDHGPGIPDSERARIFDMFYTMERGDRGGQGTGLGLTIVQAIISAHMGSVQAFPSPSGTGTMVRLELPVERRAQRDPTADESIA